MRRMIKLVWTGVVAVLLLSVPARAQRAEIPERTATPYLGAIAVETETGDVLFENNADAPAYPASVIKLLTLLTVLEAADSGQLSLQDAVTVSAAASRMGGSQVYLKEGERFTVDELLYALMVQSANDAAAALAEHVAGGRSNFVLRMQAIARRLGMTNTVVCSEHGLPPESGQDPDITTCRDLAKLCCALAKRADVFRYTSTYERPFRDGSFVMRNHNPLLKSYPECDGFKTGYYRKAGYSIAATAQKHGANRVAVVVLGCQDRLERNRTTEELLNRAFRILAQKRREAYLRKSSDEKDAPMTTSAPAASRSSSAPAPAGGERN
jgi:D-alanyl-D-alanine carboxypeptidase (penicillin-binding protein 5/6)